MKGSFRCASLLLALAAAGAWSAVSPVGTWTGRIAVTGTASASSPSKTPPDPSILAKLKADLAKLKLTLTVKKGGAYSSTVVTATGKKFTTAGKWTQKGAKVTFVAAGEGPGVTGALAKNGSAMTTPLPAGLARRGVLGDVRYVKKKAKPTPPSRRRPAPKHTGKHRA